MMFTMLERKGPACPVCHSSEHLPEARFCMICGAALDGYEGCKNESADRDQDCCWNCVRNRRRTRQDMYQRLAPMSGTKELKGAAQVAG